MKLDRAKFAPNGIADPLFQVYRREYKRYPLLTTEEEKALALRYRETGDREAAHKLITGNLGLVVKIARKLHSAQRWGTEFTEHLLDLIQEGNLGLMRAVEGYDPDRGAKFSSYASVWIKRCVQKFLNGGWAGSLPLNAPLKEGFDESYQDLLPDPGPQSDDAFADAKLQQVFRQKLEEFRQTLNSKELEILDTRILVDQPGTLQRIAKRHGVTYGRVRQIEDRLTQKLRIYLRSQFTDGVE